MAANRRSLALTDRYRDALLQLRLRATVATAQAWRNLSPEDLDGSYRAWMATAIAVVEASKVRGVALSDAYLAAFLASETGREYQPRGVDPDAYMDTEDGRSLAAALVVPLLTVKMLADSRGLDVALGMGLLRASRIVATEVLGAPRRALGDLMADTPEVKGWRRVTRPNACGACLALANGVVMDPGARLKVHGNCRCTAEPVVRGVRDRYIRPTGEEIFRAMSPKQQAELFRGRGGEEKAELLRSGAVPFAALVAHQEQAVGPATFTEASLKALRNMASSATE